MTYARTVNGSAFPNYTDSQWREFAEQICSERDGKVVLDYDTRLSQPMKADDGAAVPPICGRCLIPWSISP